MWVWEFASGFLAQLLKCLGWPWMPSVGMMNMKKVLKPFIASQQVFEIGHGKWIKYGNVLLFGNWNWEKNDIRSTCSEKYSAQFFIGEQIISPLHFISYWQHNLLTQRAGEGSISCISFLALLVKTILRNLATAFEVRVEFPRINIKYFFIFIFQHFKILIYGSIDACSMTEKKEIIPTN